jgi:hypothetical protein
MVMIIAKVVLKPLSQVVLVEYDHVVEAFAADGSDQALDKGILPGRTGRNKLLFHSQAKRPLHKLPAVNAIAIAEQIAGWIGLGKRLGWLLCGPSG